MIEWVRVWRVAARLMPSAGLCALRQALRNDDPRLLQGATTTPPPLTCVENWPVEASCLLGYPGVEEHGGFGTARVADVEEFFARICRRIDETLAEPAACRFLITWWDETPRSEAIAQLLPEVEAEIRRRLL